MKKTTNTGHLDRLTKAQKLYVVISGILDRIQTGYTCISEYEYTATTWHWKHLSNNTGFQSRN